MKLRKLDIKITDAISKMGGVFHGMFIDGYNRSASDIAGCIHTRINEGNYWFVIEMKNEAKIKIVGKWSPNSESNGNVYDTDGLSPTVTCGAHGGCEPRIKTNVPIKTICINSKVDGKRPSLEHRIYSDEGCATAVTTSFMPSISTNFRIRKLTERECFRLMGVRENDIDKLLKAGISKTQLYKLAGNSIVCDVMLGIFTNLFLTEDKNDELADLW